MKKLKLKDFNSGVTCFHAFFMIDVVTDNIENWYYSYFNYCEAADCKSINVKDISYWRFVKCSDEDEHDAKKLLDELTQCKIYVVPLKIRVNSLNAEIG